MSSTRRGTLAGLVVLALAAAGCGGGSSRPATAPAPSGAAPTSAAHSSGSSTAHLSGAQAVLASVRSTAAQKSARISLSVATSGLAAVSIDGDGTVDFATGDADLSLRFGGALGSMLAGDMEERVVDHVAYVQLPGSSRWYSVDASKVGGSGSQLPAGLGQSDPRQLLASLAAISGGVTNEGSAVIRGVDTTHYHATIDLGKAFDRARLPASLRNAAQQFLAANASGAPRMPVDVFVDAQGRVRRMALQLHLGLSGLGALFGGSGDAGSSGSAPAIDMTMTLDLYDFGAPVDVQAPPAGQVVSIGSLGSLTPSASGAPASPSAVSSAV